MAHQGRGGLLCLPIHHPLGLTQLRSRVLFAHLDAQGERLGVAEMCENLHKNSDIFLFQKP